MTMIAVLPVKRFDAAKQRLADAFDDATRRALVEAMLTDVLTALRRTGRVDAVVLVTSEPRAQGLAHAHDATVIADPAQPGHSAAAGHGRAWAVEHGATRVLLVPGDCPALDPVEVDALLAGADDPAVVIVPDRHGSGTNALVLAPPHAIDPSFGPGSRARHEAAAAASGATWAIAQPPSLLLDVDTAEDLALLRDALAARGSHGAHTHALLDRLVAP